MASREQKKQEAVVPAAAALRQLKDLLQQDPKFAKAMHDTSSTEAAAQLAAEHGVVVTPEALWRHRGTVDTGGVTWRG